MNEKKMTDFHAGHLPSRGTPAVQHASPNAALLIDFDNVTVGIRSDLGKELKALLDSDIIRGRVAVQRAYADWRRYPQYIVPLAEASIDLIMAPAYGTSKKNATDLRMAVDAIELVFTRPEIGTYILMTGDSDFSSCVLKLKEYGKYVIGVGMRESSSDLLIQNCHEYYSYHSLSGLTRHGEEAPGTREDPWLLVQKAARQMKENRDAMRTDRLKQVMIELDPGFDEKGLGYTKFSRFATEAASKGLIHLRKGENGQYEISVEAEEAAAAPSGDSRSDRDRDRDRGRRGRGRGRDRDRDRGRRPEPQPVEAAPAAEAEEAPEAPSRLPVGEATVADLPEAYALLQHAVRLMTGGKIGESVRDGDVKRRMLDLAPAFDEGKLGFGKFSRFLRQAHDEEVVDVRRLGRGSYEVALPASGTKLPPPVLTAAEAEPAEAERAEPEAEREEEKPAERGRRGRRGRRGAPEGPPPLLPGQVVSTGEEAKAAETAKPAAEEKRAEPEAKPKEEAPAAKEKQEPSAPPSTREARPAARGTGRGRRGRRAAGGEEGPPPLLPGQVVGGAEEAPAAPAAREEEPAGAAPAEPAGFDESALGLPTDDDSIRNYLVNSYRGVGRKTAESLTEAFGAGVFRTMRERPDAVRELLGRRANALLEQWDEDYARRAESAAEAAPAEPEAEAEAPAAEEAPAEKPKSRSRARGGRGRSRKKAEEKVEAAAETPAAEAAPAEAPTEEKPKSRSRRGGRGRSKAKAEEKPAAETEAEPAAEEKPKRSRSRKSSSSRSKKAKAEPEAKAAEAPAEEKPKSRSRRGGRGRTRKSSGSSE